MPNQQQWDRVYIEQMEHFAQNMSRGKRLKVGCLLVLNNRPLANGLNGMPSGGSNNLENYEVNKKYEHSNPDKWEVTTQEDYASYIDSYRRITTKPETIHAEFNAIGYCAKEGISTKGATIYQTDSPCLSCAKLLYTAGIAKVIYRRKYRDETGLEFLDSVGIKHEQI
jgi:dCMP deaminase